MRVAIKLQNGLGLSENLLLAQLAEYRGLDGVWVAEYSDRDAVTQLAILSRATERFAVGASIVPIYTRSAVVLGMTAASLSEAAPGRIRMGLGVSTDVIVERWHGISRDRPLTAMREYVAAVRDVLAGRPVGHGEHHEVVRARDFRFERPEIVQPIVLPIAALGPKMTRLAGEVGDGVLLNVVAAEKLPDVRGHAAEGASVGGRPVPPLCCDIRVGVADPQPEEELRASLRRLLASYGRVPPYNRHYAGSGFADQARLLTEAWRAGDKPAAGDAVDDEMLDSLVAVGPRERVIERLVAYAKAGLDEAILYPTVVDGDEVEGIQQVIDVAAEVQEVVR